MEHSFGQKQIAFALLHSLQRATPGELSRMSSNGDGQAASAGSHPGSPKEASAVVDDKAVEKVSHAPYNFAASVRLQISCKFRGGSGSLVLIIALFLHMYTQVTPSTVPPKPLTTPWSAIVKSGNTQQDALVAAKQQPEARESQPKESKPASPIVEDAKSAAPAKPPAATPPEPAQAAAPPTPAADVPQVVEKEKGQAGGPEKAHDVEAPPAPTAVDAAAEREQPSDANAGEVSTVGLPLH